MEIIWVDREGLLAIKKKEKTNPSPELLQNFKWILSLT